jgi:serine/threonine-protein kinase RsbW
MTLPSYLRTTEMNIVMTSTAQPTKKTISLVSEPESINIIENLIEDLRTEHNIHEDAFGNILVSVTEAVNNAIQHGNRYNPDKKVTVSYEIEGDNLIFTVSDEGPGFDFYNLPDPTAPENIEKPTGRGIFLMKHLADQVIFSDNGRSVEMYFKTSLH